MICYSFGNDASISINSNSDCEESNNECKEKVDIDYGIHDKMIARHQFDICYVAKNGAFYLKDVSSGSGVFYKLQGRKVLPEEGKVILTFSNIYFKVKIQSDENKDSVLTIAFINDDEFNQEFVFSSGEMKSFKMGRGFDCEISVKCSEVSRVQLTFVYENSVWVVYDGSIDLNHKQIPATNGTWIQVNDSIKLTCGLLLKTGQVIMDVKVQ